MCADVGVRFLLLDGPSLGFSPVMEQAIAKIVVDIDVRGTPVIVVEHGAELTLRMARYGYMLQTGRVGLEGPAAGLQEHEHVKMVCLGG